MRVELSAINQPQWGAFLGRVRLTLGHEPWSCKADMSSLENTLLNAFGRMGFRADHAPGSIREFLRKLDFLSTTTRYQKLINELVTCNDKSNLFSIVLEATFAYEFEFKGKSLQYEVRQAEDLTSIDFLRVVREDFKVYFELRLVQQRECINQAVVDQLSNSGIYKVSLEGDDEQAEIVRLQRVILAKCQDKNGKPVKFFKTERGHYNIVVVEVTDLVLGTIDEWDCLLTIYGDAEVDDVYRCGIFGLFQTTRPSYPPRIQELYAEFAHVRSTIHGVLFLRRRPGGDQLHFRIEHCFIPNRSLLTEAEFACIEEELDSCLFPWDDQNA